MICPEQVYIDKNHTIKWFSILLNTLKFSIYFMQSADQQKRNGRNAYASDDNQNDG